MPLGPALSLALAVSLLTVPARAEGVGPVPPCAGDVVPAHPELNAPPNTTAWQGANLPTGWVPLTCLGWPAELPEAVVALAGHFAGPDGINAIAERLSAVSRQQNILYWSASRQEWRQMLSESWTLSAPDKAARRPDFGPAELAAGSNLLLWRRVNDPYGGAVYRQQVLAMALDRIEVAETNISGLGVLGWTMVDPGGQQARLWIASDRHGGWTYYAISRLGAGLPFGLSRASLINRAVALFRYAAGIPTDLEPPAARR